MPRTELPIATSSSSRVARTSSTIQRADRSSTKTSAHRARAASATSATSTAGSSRVERMPAELLVARSGSRRPRPDSRASCGRRSGRAAPPAAGTCPRTRSGSGSRCTRNGSASRRVTPSTVTCCSAIASSRADCVFGIARLISSTRTTLANTGPGPELEVALALVEDREAGHVGRLEVGRALDPGRRARPRSTARSPARARSSRCPARPRAGRGRRRRGPRPRA